MSLIALKQQRANIAKDITSITEEVGKANRAWSNEENEKFDKLEADYKTVDENIRRLERAEEINAAIAERDLAIADDKKISSDEKVDKDKEYSRAFYAFARNGDNIPREQREILNNPSFRAQVTTTPASGGYLVPTTTHDMIMAARLQFNPLRSVVDVFSTPDGGTYNLPTNNDTSNEGEIIGENVAATETDLTFAQVQFGSYLIGSRAILVSNSMLQDSGSDLEGYIAKALGERIGRAEATNFTTGNGTTAPQGIVTGAADSGISASSATTITYLELVSLLHTIDPEYRDIESFRWMFHDGTLANIKKLVDGDGKPLWRPDMAQGEPATILGKQYVVNQKVAAPTTGVKSIILGDMSNFKIRDVRGFSVKRNDQIYMNKDVTAFFGFERVDSKLVNAGTNPIKYFEQA